MLVEQLLCAMQGIVEDLLQRGVAEHSEGAICIFIEVAHLPYTGRHLGQHMIWMTD